MLTDRDICQSVDTRFHRRLLSIRVFQSEIDNACLLSSILLHSLNALTRRSSRNSCHRLSLCRRRRDLSMHPFSPFAVRLDHHLVCTKTPILFIGGSLRTPDTIIIMITVDFACYVCQTQFSSLRTCRAFSSHLI
jgi:hypothetical protein